MDERTLEQSLAEELTREWRIVSTGSGYMIITDWHWPNGEKIEIYVRTVGEREDLYVVSDGGELFNFLYSQGIDLSKDERGMRTLNGMIELNGAKVVDYQLVKGAGEMELAQAIRNVLEAIKDASLILWHKVGTSESIH
ncbi:MAG: DUF1828 domain-containing protein [Acidobacteriota bacterium]